MSKITAPELTIAFLEIAASAIERGSRGIVGLVLKDTAPEIMGAKTIHGITSVPEGYSAENLKWIKGALMGYQTAPQKLIVYTITNTDETAVLEKDYKAALEFFENTKVNWIAFPTCVTDKKVSDIYTWIKQMRTVEHKTRKAVLAEATAADSDGVVSIGMSLYDADHNEIKPEALTPRIAGLIAGTPMDISCTYAPLKDFADCETKQKEARDKAVSEGNFIFMNDGEKIKVVRGVNTFTTTTGTKGDSFKKIKLVDIIDQIQDDITVTIQDNYIGKYANSYDNKCLLMSAIAAYLKTLHSEQLLANDGKVEINLEAQRNYLLGLGKKVLLEDGTEKTVEECSDDELKTANTGSHVFLRIAISILDAMEDFDIQIYI